MGGLTRAAQSYGRRRESEKEDQKMKKKAAHTRLPSVRVPQLIPALSSQRAGDVSHKPGGRLPLLSARPADTLATLKRAADVNFAAW